MSLDSTSISAIDIGPISGFPEQLPDKQAVFDEVIAVIDRHYSLAGAVRIATPLVERTSVLLSKSGGAINKEIFGLRRLSVANEDGTSQLGLRYDLTVPLARYIAAHQSDLQFPFRRQHIASVYRGERAQSGRYREFIQADLDIVGRDHLPVIADAEPIGIINGIFSALGIGDFVLKINNRKILDGFFESLGLDPTLQRKVLAVLDKANGNCEENAKKLCDEVGCSCEQADGIIKFVNTVVNLEHPADSLSCYRVNDRLSKGITDLISVIQTAQEFGVPKERMRVDFSIARGMEYYTGTVYETILLEHPSVGSICSGGRYDDLTTQFTDQTFPGVGISIGVSRLVNRLIQSDILKSKDRFRKNVLIACMSNDLIAEYIRLTAALRSCGIPTEMFFERKRLGDQLGYASRKGLGFVVILGDDEKRNGCVQVRNLLTGDQESMPYNSVETYLSLRCS